MTLNASMILVSFVTTVIMWSVIYIIAEHRRNKKAVKDCSFKYDLIAHRHMRRCLDISYLCALYMENGRPDVYVPVILKFFNEVVSIDRGTLSPKVRCSHYFSTDAYIGAINSLKDSGLLKKYEEVYNERF